MTAVAGRQVPCCCGVLRRSFISCRFGRLAIPVEAGHRYFGEDLDSDDEAYGAIDEELAQNSIFVEPDFVHGRVFLELPLGSEESLDL